MQVYRYINMDFEKVFETTINTTNAIGSCKEKNVHVKNYLIEMFEMKCFQGAFIYKIKDLIDVSSCEISKSNLTGDGSIHVKFSAQVKIFCRWDILVGVEIICVKELLVGVYKLADRSICTVTIKDGYENIKEGDKVCIQMTEIMHMPMSTFVKIRGILLTSMQVYRVYKSVGEVDTEEFKPLIEKIKYELNMRTRLNQSRLLHMEKLLYCYRSKSVSPTQIPIKNSPPWVGMEMFGANEPDFAIKNFIEMIDSSKRIDVTGFWARSRGICKSSPLIAYGADYAKTNYIEKTPDQLVSFFLGEIHTNIVAVREMVELYPEDKGNLPLYWNHMFRSQIP